MSPALGLGKCGSSRHVDRAFYYFLRAVLQSGAARPGQPVPPREGRALGSGARREAREAADIGVSQLQGCVLGINQEKTIEWDRKAGAEAETALCSRCTKEGGDPRFLVTPEKTCLGK